ncbi:hypothetical protein R6Q57_015092 [Mikania cordata]
MATSLTSTLGLFSLRMVHRRISLFSIRQKYILHGIVFRFSSEVKKLSGNANGNAGYNDCDLESAEFNKPKNFALDTKNNIYIADKSNHVIRKIGKSGVTTIAGGNIRKTGKADGPAQNASFSDDFELVFYSQRCALLISDRGNRLIRQLDLKAEDCTDTYSGSVMGSTVAWGIGVVVTCLIGFVIGFAVRPYVLPYTGSRGSTSGQHDMEAFPNQSGETNSDLLLRHQKRNC